MRHLTASLSLLALFTAPAAAASIEDLSSWSPLEDPPDAGMSFGPRSANSAEVSATGSIPSGVDIGYASVDGADVASSTSGYYFDPATDFEIAVDFTYTQQGSAGGGGIGFGIGEDVAGVDSIGAGVFITDGLAAAVGTAARVSNADQGIQIISLPGVATGRLFVEYVSTTQEVILGVNVTPGAAAPSATQIVSGIVGQWTGQPFLASFFLRSQSVALPPLVNVPALSAGSIDATFSNFEVLSGSPIAVVPEPTTLLASLGVLGVLAALRTR